MTTGEPPIRYLDLDDLLATVEVVVGPQTPIRDHGLLQSAAERPRTTVFGEDAYPTALDKAAALVESLIGNHALVDGNKRLGYAALRLFLEANGHRFDATQDERFDFIMAVADGSLRGVPEISERLARLVDIPDDP